MSDLVGNPEDRFFRVEAHFTFTDKMIHYENTPMQYTKIFSKAKIENLIGKKNIFLNISTQNIHCGYSLEPPRRVPTMYVLDQI